MLFAGTFTSGQIDMLGSNKEDMLTKYVHWDLCITAVNFDFLILTYEIMNTPSSVRR